MFTVAMMIVCARVNVFLYRAKIHDEERPSNGTDLSQKNTIHTYTYIERV